MKALNLNIPHNINIGVKQPRLMHNQQIPKGTRILEYTYMHNMIWIMILTKKDVAHQ